jgi:hypothetical protein
VTDGDSSGNHRDITRLVLKAIQRRATIDFGDLLASALTIYERVDTLTGLPLGRDVLGGFPTLANA